MYLLRRVNMTSKDSIKRKKNNRIILNIVLILIVIMLAVAPLVFNNKAKYSGSDDRATKAISQIDKNYKRWYKPVWVPPSSEIESLLFALQAAIGAGVLGYGLGYMKGKSKQEEKGIYDRY
jgi:cobalt/nickel transport protein